MLRRNRVIRPVNAPLHLAPEPLNRVRMRLTTHVPLEIVLNHPVAVALCQFLVRCVLIRHYQCACFDVLRDERVNGGSRGMRGDFRHDTPASLNESQDRCFVRRPAPTLPFPDAADVGFVHLDDLRELPRRWGAQDAHLLGDPPRGLVRYAQLSLQLFGRNPILGVGEQVDGVEPRFQRCLRFVKDRVGQWVQLVGTRLARIALSMFHAVELRALVTVRATA